jgi:uncharacterized protein DUF4012
MQEESRAKPVLERLSATLSHSRRPPAAARQVGAWWRALQSSKARTPLMVTAIVLVLLGTIVLPLRALVAVHQDYDQLKALGESGLHHLLAAKAALAPFTGMSTALQEFQPQAPAPDAPYSLLVQRQSGTAYPMDVTIHPSPSLTRQGIGVAHLTPTIAVDTHLSIGTPASPMPKAPPTTAAPNTTASNLIPDLAVVQAAQGELQAAQRDFQTLYSRLHAGTGLLGMIAAIPGIDEKFATADALATIGLDVSEMGLELTAAGLPVLQRIHAGSLASGEPLITLTDLDHLQQALTHADARLADVAQRLGRLDLNQLSLTDAQRATFKSLQSQLPHIHDLVRQVSPWMSALAWMLGVGQQRHFLVQTLDRAELRPSGGFTGDYGVLTVSDGKIQPFSLYNVNDIDYGLKTNGWIFGKRPPAPYSWWPFANWGLRDANLSPDFPTTAKIEMGVFQNEGGGAVDGVIQVSPVVIAHVLNITGPISVPDYNETITADNLEAKIHYYQQDPAGIAKQQQLNPNDHTHSLRKRFTQLLAQLLQDKVKRLPLSQLMLMVKQVWKDIGAKDLQLYVTNQQVEDLLVKRHAAGQMDTTPKMDGYAFVQANVSAAKSTPYVAVTQRDDITLDAQGGALHQLTITLRNNPQGPIYGYPTYRDYVRIYVPPQARYISGSGFDQLKPMCTVAPPTPDPTPTPGPSPTPTPLPTAAPTVTPTPTPSPQANSLPPIVGAALVVKQQPPGLPQCSATPYATGERACPAQAYTPPNGAAFSVLASGNATVPVLDALGAPPNRTSDLPGRSMWGGYVIIPSACTATIRLRWYVPDVAHT